MKFSYQKLHGPSYEWLDGMKPIGSPIILRMRNHSLTCTVMIETLSYSRGQVQQMVGIYLMVHNNNDPEVSIIHRDASGWYTLET